MKKLFTILAVAATLVSCAKDETIAVNKGEAIQFGNAFVENSTRAADPSYSTTGKGVALTTFKVYGAVEGVNIFDGDNVTKGDNVTYGDAWACDGQQQYWIAGANYVFDAVVDATTVVTDTNTGLPVTLTYDATTQKDMLHDRVTTVGKPTENDGLVAFGFTHLLSKINFTVTNNSATAEGYSFVVKNITFNGATAATYDVKTAAWGAATATGATIIGNERTVPVDGVDTKVKDIVVASKAASAELATEVLFIPGTYGITFTVDILYNGNVLSTVNYPATGTTYSHTLAANNAYNFNVNVSVGDPIQFTATTMPEWGNGNTHDSDDDDDVNDYIPLQ